VLILLNVFFFSDVLFTDNTYFYRDLGNFHQPLKKLVTEAYSRGEWPLWNPYIQFGQPLLANPNAMAVYPTQILFHILPFDFAFDLNLVLHCLIGGLGAFYLARALNLSPIAALAAGVAYNFNGVVLSLINVPLLAAIGGLLPWLALLLWKVVRGPSPVNVAFSSLLFGLLLLVLEPLTTYAVFLFLVPFGLYAFLTRPPGVSARRVAVGLLIVVVSGFCLGGVQILPTLELLQNSGREKGLPFETVSYWSVHPFSLTQALFPDVWKDTFDLTGIQSGWSTGFFGSREAYIVSCYAGLSCLMIAILGLVLSDRGPLKWILVSVTVAAAALALGKYTPLYSLLFRYLPPFRWGRYPAKYLLTTAICFSLLTGLGVNHLKQLGCGLQASVGKKRLILYFILIGGLLISSGLLATDWVWQKAGFSVVDDVIRLTYQGEPAGLSQSVLRDSILYLWMVLGAGLLLVFFAATGSRKRASWIAVIATILIFFDLLSNHVVNPLVRSEAYGRSPITKWLVNHTPTERLSRVYYPPERESPFRILGKTDSFIWSFLFRSLGAWPYTGVGHHIQYSSFMPIDRLETLTSQRIHAELRETPDIGKKLDDLAKLNTGYIVSMNPLHTPLVEWQVSFDLNSDRLLHVYRLKTASPRAYLADLEVLPPAKEGRGSHYYLPVGSTDGRLASGDSRDSVRIGRYSSGQVDLFAKTDKPSMLVLLDSYYPGWRVWVNGREQRIQAVNRAFRGVIVKPGQNQVTFRYDPKSFRYGLALTLSTLGAWFVVLMFLYWRRDAGSRKQSAEVSETELVSP